MQATANKPAMQAVLEYFIHTDFRESAWLWYVFMVNFWIFLSLLVLVVSVIDFARGLEFDFRVD